MGGNSSKALDTALEAALESGQQGALRAVLDVPGTQKALASDNYAVLIKHTIFAALGTYLRA